MPYQRGDIVEVNLAMPPDGRIMNHPAVIISQQEVYLDDSCYIVIMLTSQNYEDVYSYVLEDYMFSQGTRGVTNEARCQLITYVLASHIVSAPRARVKKAYVDEIVEHIVNAAL